jgi:hypothetical protein
MKIEGDIRFDGLFSEYWTNNWKTAQSYS